MHIEPLTAAHNLSGFVCKESEIESWLKKNAMAEQNARRSKTTLLIDDTFGVVGYMTLAVTQVEGGSMPPALVGKSKKDCVGFLLAKLGVHQDHMGKHLGHALVNLAFLRCIEVEDRIGGRVVVVDLLNKDLDPFYESAGFSVSVGELRRGVTITELRAAKSQPPK